tara:strand:+ start:7718 stop:7909 length:192 start_codon:yes stop_codon:yes gene_type:complete
MEYPYIVIDAPGHYGDHGTVWSRHRTLSAALRAKGGPQYAVARNDWNLRRGDKFHRAWNPGGK